MEEVGEREQRTRARERRGGPVKRRATSEASGLPQNEAQTLLAANSDSDFSVWELGSEARERAGHRGSVPFVWAHRRHVLFLELGDDGLRRVADTSVVA